jgi:hypothetical protein
MISLIAAALVALAVAWAARLVSTRLEALRKEEEKSRTLTLLEMFAPAQSAAQSDPRTLLVWQPIARTAHALFPEEFASIERALGAKFPFTQEQLQDAHARWTADWLAWERTHDAEYKRKIAETEHANAAEPAMMRARIDAVEREKLDVYQRRYEEYIRVAKALQAVQF